MYLNENVAIKSDRILLIPYLSQHVLTYHSWMQDADTREATASEALTLKEEYAMQISWRTNADKLTFITCLPFPSLDHSVAVIRNSDIVMESLVGDVNLFLTYDEETEDLVGEVELMIARKEFQGKGLGRASLLAFLKYVIMAEGEIVGEFNGKSKSTGGTEKGENDRRLSYLRAKIQESNHRSIKLFQSIGFSRHGQPNYFGEIELRWEMPAAQKSEAWSSQEGLEIWQQLVYLDSE